MKSWQRFSFVIAVTFACATVRASSPAATHALVIGFNGSGDQDAQELHYADDDALATHQLLTEAGVTSVLLTRLDAQSRRLHAGVHIDGPPTLEEVHRRFEALVAQMRGDRSAEFLLFFSGHGDVEYGEGYAVLQDGRLTRQALYRLLERSPAVRNHVVIDACKSYFLAFGKGPGGTRTAKKWSASDVTDRGVLDRTGFILSTSSARDSHEWEKFGAGVFSHEVRSALRGAADLDGDQSITYGEIGAFLYTANATVRHARYVPDFAVRPPGKHPGDLRTTLLNWPTSGDALLITQRDSAGSGRGHIYIEDALGERLVDLHAERGVAVRVALPARRPLFVRRSDGRREWEISRRGVTRLSRLSRTGRPVRSKGAMHLAFESLFSDSFSPSDLAAFAGRYRASADPFGVSTLWTDMAEGATGGGLMQRASLWTAGGSLFFGGAVYTWAMMQRASGQGESHRRQTVINRRIEQANLAVGASLALAGAALTTWLALELWPAQGGEESLTLTAHPTNGGFFVMFAADYEETTN